MPRLSPLLVVLLVLLAAVDAFWPVQRIVPVAAVQTRQPPPRMFIRRVVRRLRHGRQVADAEEADTAELVPLPDVPAELQALQWTTVRSYDGKPYFLNEVTGETSWEAPVPPTIADTVESDPAIGVTVMLIAAAAIWYNAGGQMF